MSNVITLHPIAELPWSCMDTVLFKDEQVIARFDDSDFDTPTNIANTAFAAKSANAHTYLVQALQNAERKLVELRTAIEEHGIAISCTDVIIQAQDALIKAGA